MNRQFLPDNKEVYNLKQKLKLAWYFDTWLEKSILILSSVALIYSIVRILIQGVW